jgi:hypothetical protein
MSGCFSRPESMGTQVTRMRRLCMDQIRDSSLGARHPRSCFPETSSGNGSFIRVNLENVPPSGELS